MKPTVAFITVFVAVVGSVGWLWRRKQKRNEQEKPGRGTLDDTTSAVVPFAPEYQVEAVIEPSDSRDDPRQGKSVLLELQDACCLIHSRIRRSKAVGTATINGAATMFVVDALLREVHVLFANSVGAGTRPEGEGFTVLLSDSVWRNAPMDDFLLLLTDAASLDTPVSHYPTLIGMWFDSEGMKFPPGYLPFRMASLADVF